MLACRGRIEETGGTSAGRTPSVSIPPVEAADVPVRERRPASGSPPVIWLGLDGLDWELLDRLSAEGKLPNWKRLTEEGYTASLESFLPLLSPILWTTAVTGVGPEHHRVLDFQEVDPATGRKMPVSGRSRRAPAVWNIASAAGRKVGVVGWWATHPAEEVNGFFVSDHASPVLFGDLPLAGVAFPPALETGVAQVVSRDARVSAEDLTPFVGVSPGEIATALSGNLDRENPILALSRIIGATRVSHRIARDLYDRHLPDLLALYLQGTDEVGHVFALHTPPKLPCATDADLARYGRAVERYYALVDRLLGQWMRRAAEDGGTLLVHSDHGFKWGADRPCGFASGNWATAAFWHRLDGAFAAWGAGVRAGQPRGKASLFDVAPTVLSLLEAPRDPRMPGSPISVAFRNLSPGPRRDSSRLAVRRVVAEEPTADQSSEFAKKLMALGYISGAEPQSLAAPGGDRPGMTEGAWNNLGVYLRDTRKDPAGAREAFERSLALRPRYYSPLFNLAILERSRGNARAAEEWLLRSLAVLKGDPAPAVVGWGREYQRRGRTPAARSLLVRAAGLYPASEEIARELAHLLFRSKDCPGALAALERFGPGTSQPRTLNALALFRTCLGHRAEVVRLLERSLALDPGQAEVARSLSAARGRPLS